MKTQEAKAGIAGLPPSQWTDIAGPVHYVEWPYAGRSSGEHEPVFVCIHGLGGSHVNWVAIAPELAQRGRVLALDLPGFGFTPLAARSCTMRNNRALVAKFLATVARADGGTKRAGRAPVILVGSSMGGLLSVLQSAIEPESADALILSSPAMPWAAGGWPAPQVLGAFVAYSLPIVGEFAGRLRTAGLDPEKTVRMGLKLTCSRPWMVSADHMRMHVEMVTARRGDSDAAPAFVEAARSLTNLMLHPQTAHRAMDAVEVPVLMMHGTEDKLVPVEYADAAAARERTWKYRRFPDVGHAIQIEDPERWTATTGEWLDAQKFS